MNNLIKLISLLCGYTSYCGLADDYISGILLNISIGIPIWKDVWVFLAEDMANSAAWDNLQTSPTHPRSERDLCGEVNTPVMHLYAFSAKFYNMPLAVNMLTVL